MTYDNDWIEADHEAFRPKGRRKKKRRFRKGSKTIRCATCGGWFRTDAGRDAHARMVHIPELTAERDRLRAQLDE